MEEHSAGGREDLVTTRQAWHAVGELVIAGPQYRAHGTIRLGVVPGGFGGVTLPLRVVGDQLIWEGGQLPLRGTCRDLGAQAGVVAGRPEGVYAEGSGVAVDDPLDVDSDAATELAEWLEQGDTALRSFAPGQLPILWPEHFDLAVSVDEINYGISLGDAGHPDPYAYVGPWTPRHGDFWNASFGAVRSADDLGDAGAVAAFFAEGRRLA